MDSVEEIDVHLDAILKASGSALANYSLPGTLARMRAAVTTALHTAHLQGRSDAEAKNVLSGLPDGKYVMRVSVDDPAAKFPVRFSFRCEGRLFVLFPTDDNAKKAMGVSEPSQ